MGTYRIMTFDGGGVLGALSLQLLNRLSKLTPQLVRKTDVFAGNSIGSITAMALASGRTPKETFRFFKKEILPAFSDPLPGGPVFNQQLSLSRFIKAIREFFPDDLRLKDLNPKVVIPSFHLYDPEVDRWNPVLFNNFPGSPYLNEKVSDVVLRSSAAPTAQRAYQNYVDGYLVATNPSTACISFAVGKACVPLNKIAVLSIGTGEQPTQLRRDTGGWGMVSADNIRPENLEDLPPNWGVLQDHSENEPLLPFLQITSSSSAYYESMVSKNLLGKRFYRLDPRIPNFSKTDPTAVPALIEIANETDLEPAERFVEKNWAADVVL
ncbi:patatin-like phospholipase family protein [Fictibacillus fluitans]|uniref:Patatin-like phospholipase family protein n=1 Tax=Fictibacillus fluitans TaxID=3058422 RepID=A0ABT8HUG2_9BACL|nr:patatin-like phospholipase family protein [Fictibacillus sp. NE201]MDN4523907.1 patatin-like phospholipase family protein [Fictibacillus sp. NE201]